MTALRVVSDLTSSSSINIVAWSAPEGLLPSDLEDEVPKYNYDRTSQANFTFRGLIAPVFTPFKNDMTINLKIIPEYAKYLAGNGIQGILVNGTTGEGVSLNINERKASAEAWVNAVKSTKQHLMIQIGGCTLADVIELAKHAESIGVDSLLCLPELYFKPTTPSNLIEYFEQIAKAAPKTPLLYYHIPGFTHVNIHMGHFLNEIAGKVPTFQGIKFTSTLLDEGIAAVRANDGKYAVFLGADQIMAGAYTLGFDSAISTSQNIFPELNIRILEAIKKSNVQEARKAQNSLNDLINAITKNGTWVPTMKAAMNLLSPFDFGEARAPLQNLTPAQKEEMKKDLKALGINN